jgi:hypothetical protein
LQFIELTSARFINGISAEQKIYPVTTAAATTTMTLWLNSFAYCARLHTVQHPAVAMYSLFHPIVFIFLHYRAVSNLLFSFTAKGGTTSPRSGDRSVGIVR